MSNCEKTTELKKNNPSKATAFTDSAVSTHKRFTKQKIKECKRVYEIKNGRLELGLP